MRVSSLRQYYAHIANTPERADFAQSLPSAVQNATMVFRQLSTSINSFVTVTLLSAKILQIEASDIDWRIHAFYRFSLMFAHTAKYLKIHLSDAVKTCFEATMNRESVISKYQKKYRDQANIQSITNLQKIKLLNVERGIERLNREIADIKTTLHGAQSTGSRRKTAQFLQRLEKNVADIKRHDQWIEEAKLTMNQLKEQIVRVGCERMRCERASISDDDFALKLKKARRMVVILESELDVKRIKENKCRAQNNQLLLVIRYAMIERVIFNQMFTALVDRLHVDREMLVAMVDRVLLAYTFSKQLCREMDESRRRARLENQYHIRKMSTLSMVTYTDNIAVDFHEQKSRKITYKDIDGKEVARRDRFKAHFGTKATQYRNIRSKIVEFTGDTHIDAVITKYEHQSRRNFATCLYLNDIERRVTCNRKRIDEMQENINAARKDDKTRKQTNNQFVKLESRLLAECRKTEGAQRRLNDVTDNVQLLYDRINPIFDMLGCDVNDTDLVVDFENETANERNFRGFFKQAEARIRDIMSFVYYCEREDRALRSRTVHDVDVVNYRLNECPQMDVLPPCPECTEAEELARAHAAKPRRSSSLRAALQTIVQKRELNNRVHHLQDCPRAHSRALLAEWFEEKGH